MLEKIFSWFANYFQSIDYDKIFNTLLTKGVQIILIILLFSVIRKLIERLVSIYFNRLMANSHNPSRDSTMYNLVQNVIQYAYYFLLAYTLLAIVGVPVAALLAGAGVASLAIGLGAQGFVSDVVNGFFILFEHQYDVGDSVVINDYSGEVARVGIRTTIVNDFDGSVHYIPNRNITDVTNQSRSPMRVDIDLLIYADTDPDAIRQAVSQRLEDLSPDKLLAEAPNILGVQRDANGRLIYRVRLKAVNGEQLQVQGKYYAHLIDALDKANINQPSGNELITK
ncbi:hypothetical protein AWM75_02275 [Aerococcus urinaehominis]|uniref:Uncharacterized protein n=1 Tax=Aerococcus urinaehominis TaxID=128944 RepID=A0A120IAR6_9LACT|nr:mechanosensitive ion channel family protein [Aerococcus urinaehominis]AMB98888.1 hypothetical protein AWM75_02275 [Aerococcus urinaehominis]SDM15855.1 small conductance mechanosensitive channel [Aerococcus urinaehominis]